MEKKDVSRIVRKPYNLDILDLIDKKSSMAEISRKTGLSYKSVFQRIQELKEYGIIENKNGLQLSAQNKDSIKKDLDSYNYDQKHFEKDFESKDKVRNLLTSIRKNRFIDPKLISEDDEIELLLHLLNELGYVKTRLEITKKGINYLKDKKNL